MGYIVIKGALEIVWQTKIKVEHSSCLALVCLCK